MRHPSDVVVSCIAIIAFAGLTVGVSIYVHDWPEKKPHDSHAKLAPVTTEKLTIPQVREDITDIVANFARVDVTEVTLKTRLSEDLNVDQVDLVELVLKVEDRFEISIPDEQWEKIRTVEDIVECVRGILAKSGRLPEDA